MAYPFLTFGKFLKVLKHEIFFGPENFSGKNQRGPNPKKSKNHYFLYTTIFI